MSTIMASGIKNVSMGSNYTIITPVNLYDCTIGDDVFIGPFTEIQKDVVIGDRSRVQSHCFICTGVIIEEDVFIGHGVKFCNDRYPEANNPDYRCEQVIVQRGASIGNGAVILPGVTIGEGALVGAGSVVTKDVMPHTIVAGNPARVLREKK